MICDHPGCDYVYGDPAPPASECVGKWYARLGYKTHLLVRGRASGVNGTEMLTACGRWFGVAEVGLVDSSEVPERACKVCERIFTSDFGKQLAMI